MKHCPTCKCDEVPDLQGKCPPGGNKLLPLCSAPRCGQAAHFIKEGRALCYEHAFPPQRFPQKQRRTR